PPEAPVVEFVGVGTDNVLNKTENAADSKDGTTPVKVTATNPQPGDKVTITYTDPSTNQPATQTKEVGTDGTATFDVPVVHGKPVSVTATTADKAGNVSDPSNTAKIDVDLVAEVDVKVSDLIGREYKDAGGLKGFSRDISIKVDDVEPGQEITVKVTRGDGSVGEKTLTVKSDGTVDVYSPRSSSVRAIQNIKSVEVSGTDKAGNEFSKTVEVKNDAPKAIIDQVIDDKEGGKVGALDDGDKTNDNAPTIKGHVTNSSGEPLAYTYVKLFDNGGNPIKLMQVNDDGTPKITDGQQLFRDYVVADENGNFEFKVGEIVEIGGQKYKIDPLPDGDHKFTTAIYDLDNGLPAREKVDGSDSNEFDINIDTVAPEADVVASRDGQVNVVVPNNDGEKLTISYTATDGSTKEAVYTKGANGVWSTASTDANIAKTSVPDAKGNQVINIKDAGTQNGTDVKATIVDGAGNEGSDKATALAPLQAPKVTYGEDTNANNALTRDESSKDGNTAKTTATVTLSDGAVAGDVLTITDKSGKVVGKYNVVENNGNLELQPDSSVDNSQNVVKGNSVEVPATFNIAGNGKDTSASITAEISTTDGSNVTQSSTKAINTERLGNIELDFYEGDYKMPYEDWQNGGATKEQAASDGDIGNATAKIKLPTNIATGDVINIKITDNFEGTISGKTFTPKVIDVQVAVTKNADGTFTFTETTNTGKVGTKTIAPSNGSIVLDVEKVPTHSRDEMVQKFKGTGIGDGDKFGTGVNVELLGSGGEVRTANKIHQIMKDMNELKISYEDGEDGALSVAENFKDGDMTKANVVIDLPYAAKVGQVVNVEFKVDGKVVETKDVTITSDMKSADKITLQAPVESGKRAEASASITTEGNQTHKANTSVNVEADTTPPEAPVVEFVGVGADNVLNKTENAADSKDGTTPVKVTATNPQPGDKVTITYTDPSTNQPATQTKEVGTDGTATFDVPVVHGKPVNVEATTTDSFGNTSTAAPATLNVDLKASLALESVGERGFAYEPGMRKYMYNKPITIRVDDIENGDNYRISVTLNGGRTLSTGDMQVVDGVARATIWSTNASELDNFIIRATAIDAAGNEAILEVPYKGGNFVLNAPTITSVSDDVSGGKTGDLANNDKTNDATPTIRGTAQPGVGIEIYDGDKLIGTTRADQDGNFVFESSALKDGVHSFNAKAVDGDLKSVSSSVFEVEVDTKVGIEIKADGEIVTTDAGNAKPSAMVDGNPVALVEQNGKFYIPKDSLNTNSKISATVTDEAGNTASVDTTAVVSKQVATIPSDANSAIGQVYTYRSGGYGGGYTGKSTVAAELQQFLDNKPNQGLYMQGGNIQTGAGGVGNGQLLGNTSLLSRANQVYSFSGNIGMNKTLGKNSGFDMFIETTNTMKFKALIKIDGKVILAEEITISGAGTKGIELSSFFPNGLERGTAHKYEIVFDITRSYTDRNARVGFYDENGNKVYMGNNDSLNFVNDKVDLDGYTYNADTGSFEKVSSSVSGFKEASSKTGYDVDGTDNIDTIDHSSSTKGEYIDGKGGNDTIKAGNGNDTIDGGAGADIIDAGAGDDRIVFDQNDTKVDGGTGHDTLIVNESIDFSKIANLDSKVENIEALQLGKDGADGAIKVILNADSVSAIKDSSGILEVNGDGDDILSLKGFSKLTEQNDKAELDKVAKDNNVDQSTHDVYKSTTSAGETVYIEVDKMIKVEDVQ
ncbi:Ig-like domain-containing protein, partial [Campylobacter mucosalis]|uniref:Ig-like domain-containing protein n=1 Tax=Campylobacter mucosalis TaxID=202 RepID=UPI002015EF11